MRTLLTFKEMEILNYYWETEDVFALSDLLEAKIIRHPKLGRFTLNRMVSGWLLLSRRSKAGEPVYIEAIQSKGEWDAIMRHGRLSAYERVYYIDPDLLDKCLEETQNKFWTI